MKVKIRLGSCSCLSEEFWVSLVDPCLLLIHSKTKRCATCCCSTSFRSQFRAPEHQTHRFATCPHALKCHSREVLLSGPWLTVSVWSCAGVLGSHWRGTEPSLLCTFTWWTRWLMKVYYCHCVVRRWLINAAVRFGRWHRMTWRKTKVIKSIFFFYSFHNRTEAVSGLVHAGCLTEFLGSPFGRHPACISVLLLERVACPDTTC